MIQFSEIQNDLNRARVVVIIIIIVNELISIRTTIIFSVTIMRRMNHSSRYNDQMTRTSPYLLAAITVNHQRASRLRYPEIIGEIFENRCDRQIE